MEYKFPLRLKILISLLAFDFFLGIVYSFRHSKKISKESFDLIELKDDSDDWRKSFIYREVLEYNEYESTKEIISTPFDIETKFLEFIYLKVIEDKICVKLLFLSKTPQKFVFFSTLQKILFSKCTKIEFDYDNAEDVLIKYYNLPSMDTDNVEYLIRKFMCIFNEEFWLIVIDTNQYIYNSYQSILDDKGPTKYSHHQYQ